MFNKTQVIPEKEHFENKQEVIATFYGFDYCGYCKKFQPLWDEVQTLKFNNDVEFRYVEANTLSDDEKEAISYYTEPSYAPMVILTVDGKNIEFEQQSEKPFKGLDVFISSNGVTNCNKNSEHV